MAVSPASTDAVLALNAGSSSLKFALFARAADGGIAALCKGGIEGIGDAPHFIARDARGATLAERRWPDGAAHSHESLLGDLLEWTQDYLGPAALVAVGHRVVHGGVAVFPREMLLLARVDRNMALVFDHQIGRASCRERVLWYV